MVETVRELVGKVPVFGICMGHQLLCRAVGLETFKLPFGHRGANHPVKDLATGRIDITSQNHGFAVQGPAASTHDRHATSRCAGRPTSAPPSSPTSTSTTARSRAWCCATCRARRSSTTRRPAPGPHDALYLFDRFLDQLRRRMPRRDDIKKILVLGAGPIVIGQAAEFDYSGAQACKVLLEEGYEVVLVNSNPATIMTDPEFADRDLHRAADARVGGRGDRAASSPTRCCPRSAAAPRSTSRATLHEDGTLERHGVELIGANYEAIRRAEDRDAVPRDDGGAPGCACRAVGDRAQHGRGRARAAEVGLPAIVRPGFTMGGEGGGIARHRGRVPRARGRGPRRLPDRPGAASRSR